MNIFETQEKSYLASGRTLGDAFLSSPFFGADKGVDDDENVSDSWIINDDKAELSKRYEDVKRKAIADASSHALQFLIDAKRAEGDWEKQISSIFSSKAITQAAQNLERGFGLPFTNRALMEDQDEQHFSSPLDKKSEVDFQFNY